MKSELLNSNNLKEKLKSIGEHKNVSPEVQFWLDTVAHKHWLKILPQDDSKEIIDESWFYDKRKNTIFKQLVMTPTFVSEVEHLVDFLANHPELYKNLNKLNYLQAQTKAKEWIERLNQKISLEEDFDALKIVEQIDFQGETYTLYDLGSDKNLQREGKVMKNCISTYINDQKGYKFLSLRDSRGNSLVNIGLYKMKDHRSDEEYENIIDYETFSKDSNMSENEMNEKYDRYRQQAYSELIEKRGLCYHIFEIKEKNNELLSTYEEITQLFLNKCFAKPYSLANINIVKLSHGSVLNNFVVLRDKHDEVVRFDALKPEDFKNIKFIPYEDLKKLKSFIGDVSWDLMIKTPWLKLENKKEMSIYCKGSYESIDLRDIEADKISLATHSEANIVLDNVVLSSIGNSESLEIKCYAADSMIEIKNSHLKKTDIIVSNSIATKLSDTRIEELSIHNSYINKNTFHFFGMNKNTFHILAVDSTIDKLSNPDSERLSIEKIEVDTLKNTIIHNDKSVECASIASIVNAQQEQFRPFSADFKEYLVNSICFEEINIKKDITCPGIQNDRIERLIVDIPANDKKMLLSSRDELKGMIVEKILKESPNEFYEAFQQYLTFDKDEKFSKILEDNIQFIKDINQEFHDDPNEINYADPLSNMLVDFFSPQIKSLSATHLKKMEMIRDVFIEHSHNDRVNHGRTKLSEGFAGRLANVFMNEDSQNIFSIDAKTQIEDLFKSPISLKNLQQPKPS